MTNEKLAEALDLLEKMSSEARKEVCQENRLLFTAYYFPQYLQYKFAPFHFDMFSDLEDLFKGKIKELGWIMFRESAKTSIAKVAAVIHTIVYKKRKYLNVDSFDKANAESILFDVTNALMQNKRIIQDFGQLFSKKRNSEEAEMKRISKFITKNKVLVEAHSTQESVRGRVHEEQRPDFLLLDDFETNKTKDSVAYTQQVIKHINEFATGLAPNAITIYLGNYITEFGSVQELIDRAKEDNNLRIRMVSVENEDRTASTWEDKYGMTDSDVEGTNKVSLESKKARFGTTVYAAEMLNQPIDIETQEFPKTLFKYRTAEEVDRLSTRNFLTVDTAVSEKTSADFSGFCDNRVDRENNWNLRAWRMKIPPNELIETLFTLHKKNHYDSIGIEKTIYLQVLKPFLDREMRERNTFLPIVELDHRQTMKEARIRALQPRYESGSIYHVEGECRDLEDELLRFPNAVHDDVSDATQYQDQIAQPPHRQGAFKSSY